MDFLYRKSRKGSIRLFSYIYTLLLRLIGAKIGKNVIFYGPIDFRGSLKSISIESNCVIQKRVCLNTMNTNGEWGKIKIKNKAYICDNTIISSAKEIVIGENTNIAANGYLVDHDHKTAEKPFLAEKIEIGSNSWLGAQVKIVKGITLGDHVVVGAGSVVTKSFSGYNKIAGIPAKKI